jgi:hypothetical protein
LEYLQNCRTDVAAIPTSLVALARTLEDTSKTCKDVAFIRIPVATIFWDIVFLSKY